MLVTFCHTECEAPGCLATVASAVSSWPESLTQGPHAILTAALPGAGAGLNQLGTLLRDTDLWKAFLRPGEALVGEAHSLNKYFGGTF